MFLVQLLFRLLMVIMVVSLLGCNNEDEVVTTSMADSGSIQEPSSSPPHITDLFSISQKDEGKVVITWQPTI